MTAKPEPSKEQQEVIDVVKKGKNVIVDAVAGSGKTTTVLFIAQELPTLKIIQITYNSQLKLEVRQKTERLGIKNLTIHTYHSLAREYYDITGYTDTDITYIVAGSMRPQKPIDFDIIIIDESQDMTPLYYDFVVNFIENQPKAQLAILGDKYQCVYEFKGADPRFLTFANHLYSVRGDFVYKQLSTSYRVSRNIAEFVNKCMIGDDRIIAPKRVPIPVFYYRINIFDEYRHIYTEIISLLRVYKPEDIFVLVPSVKEASKSPFKKLENMLVQNDIPCFVSRTEGEMLVDDDILKGKLVFTTYNQSKGRERKIVFVYGFDAGFFKYMCGGDEVDESVCPSRLYVAATRATRILYLIAHYSSDPLPFLRMSLEEMAGKDYIKVVDTKHTVQKEVKEVEDVELTRPLAVTDIIRFMDERLLRYLAAELKAADFVNQISGRHSIVSIETKFKFGDFVENVADIIGTSIPAFFEYTRTGSMSIRSWIDSHITEPRYRREHPFYVKTLGEITYPPMDPRDIFQMANLYISMGAGIYSKLAQIRHYDFMNREQFDQLLMNYDSCGISDAAQYEKGVATEWENDETGIALRIVGYIDIVDYGNKTVWEVKCVECITIEHIVQVMIYAWICMRMDADLYRDFKYKVVNIRTGEILEIRCEEEKVDEIVCEILGSKYGKKEVETDAAFIGRKIVRSPVEKKKRGRPRKNEAALQISGASIKV